MKCSGCFKWFSSHKEPFLSEFHIAFIYCPNCSLKIDGFHEKFKRERPELLLCTIFLRADLSCLICDISFLNHLTRSIHLVPKLDPFTPHASVPWHKISVTWAWRVVLLSWDPVPFLAVLPQELFGKLHKMASISSDMFIGRERFATLLWTKLTETVILWLSNDQSFWDDIEEGHKPLGPIGLLQVNPDRQQLSIRPSIHPDIYIYVIYFIYLFIINEYVWFPACSCCSFTWTWSLWSNSRLRIVSCLVSWIK